MHKDMNFIIGLKINRKSYFIGGQIINSLKVLYLKPLRSSTGNDRNSALGLNACDSAVVNCRGVDLDNKTGLVYLEIEQYNACC